jgi:hypothetical protein
MAGGRGVTKSQTDREKKSLDLVDSKRGILRDTPHPGVLEKEAGFA